MVEQIPNIIGISDDEIGNSQPISLPSSNDSESKERPISVHNRPPKKTGQKGNFRSIEEIDSKYRHVFSYPYFNFVQSSVIEDALYTDKSMVVCAPTGSGKTVVFEMAIVHLLMELEDIKYTDDFKIIYMAPVKALCTERLTEWYPKFNKLGLLCIEVTGDTDVDFPQLKPYRIIITTPEKWDMLTRRWKDHRSLVEVIKLFLIDEVHILNDELRGPVLEAVVSRMKTIESSVQSAHRIEKLKAQYQGTHPTSTSTDTSVARIRFIAVSATVSNPEDVAAWLGTKDRQAVYYKFGNESRPVKLKRVVEGYPCAEGTSIFKFDIILSYKLWPIIQKYNNGKPTLIFCNTRKSVVLTAETLSKEITVNFSTEHRMKLTALASTIKTKKIQSLVMSGIGCHHAGLLYEERMNIEHAFRNRDLPILITTTTLAMGVNLPAHLVIIKNTQQYVNGAYQEYSISTILQMVGRAGRPQFDTEATAVIMTRLQDKARYQALVSGSEPLQSYLHKRLAENLNSEAALCTVGDVAQCVQWLNSTFFSVRAASDPRRYLGLPHAAPAQLISKKIEELCIKAMNGLASAGLITMDEASCIESTEAGRLMSVYYLDLETMKLIMKLEGTESLERLLWMVCESHELSDMHLRVDERRCLNALNRNNAAATIRYPMKGKINSRQMKLNCIIQAVLGCLPIPDPSLNQEATKIMRIADRVCKCLVSYVTRPNFYSQRPKFFTTILNSLILAKCISTRLWENSPYVSRQLKGIGPTFSSLLASAGKVNFMLLEESHPRDLERIMNKGPPAGNVLRKQISLLPKYSLTATPINENTVEIQLSLLNHAFLSENRDNLTAGINHKSNVIVGDSENCLLYFTNFTESNLINVYDGFMNFTITRSNNNEQKIYVHCVSSSVVGIDAQCEYVFKNINITSTNIENPQHLSLVSSKNPTQPASSDIAKIRKRKTQNDGEKTQSKEKKKRETELIAKFHVLKESFEKVSKEIKVNFNETAEKSTKILEKLIEPEDSCHKASNEPELQDLMLSSDSFQNAFQVELEYDDFVDDKQVNHILDDIEKEIKIGVNKSVATTSCQISPRSRNIQTYKNDCKTINYNIPKNKNFEKLIEPEDSCSSASNEPELQNLMLSSDSFQNAFQVELEYDDFVDDKQVNHILDDIEKEIKIGVNKSVATTSCQISPRSRNIQTYKNDCKTINYNIPKNKNFNTKRSIYNKQNNYDFLYKIERSINKESDTAEIENDTGFNNAVKLKLAKYLESTNNDSKAKTNAICIIEPTIRSEGENFIKCYDTHDMIINDANERQDKCEITNTLEVLRQNSESDCINNDKIALENESSRYEKDTINENFIISTNGEIVTNEFKLPLLENNIINNDEENDSKKIVTVASNEINNNMCNIEPNILIMNNKSLMRTPEFGTLKSITSLKTISVADSNDLENFNHCLPLSHNYNESILPLLENKCLAAYNNDNHLKTNLNSTVLTNRNTSKYNMKYHSFNKTNYINTTIENTNKEKVRLIGKLEINLNLTEIVSSNNDNFEVNTEKQNTKIEEDSGSTYICNTDVNKLKLNTNKNIMEICNTTYKCYNDNLSSDTKDKNADFEDTVDKENKLPKTPQTVNNILQKYIAKKRNQNDIKNEQVTQQGARSESNGDKNIETNSVGRDMKLKRKYKIRDLENLEVDLPESLIARNGEPATLISSDIIGNTCKWNNTEADDVGQNNICNIMHEIDDLENNMPPKFMLEELTDSALNLEVSEAILNPKMLLQSVSEDNEEDVIPPPPEFRDYDETSSNSSIHEDKINVEYSILESQDYANESEPRENKCFERSEIDLSPSREVQKWTISSKTRDLIFNPTMSYTAMDKNNIESKNTSSFFKTRSAKLSEFKFKRKNVYRK